MARGGQLTHSELIGLRERPGKHGDGAGLYFVVSVSGTANWSYRYMIDGTAREMGLGPFPAVGLAKAREKANAAASLRADGIDPLEHRRRLQVQDRLAASRAKTFDECWREHFRVVSKTFKSEKHRTQWLQQMTDYVSPVIGNLTVADVGRMEVLRVLMQMVGPKDDRRPLWLAKRETADRCRQRIEAVLDVAAAMDLRPMENPARLNVLRPLLPKIRKKVRHHVAMEYQDAPAFYAKVRRAKGVSARALEFTILTGARTSETLYATWSEIDFEHEIWTRPASRMKADEAHRVPLSRPALSVLKRVRGDRKPRQSDYIFPGQSKGGSLSNMAMLNLVKDLGGSALTVHGFRATFRGWGANRTRFGEDVLEAALAHREKSKTVRAYHRTDLFEKRVVLHRRWGIFLRTVLRAEREAKGIVTSPKSAGLVRNVKVTALPT